MNRREEKTVLGMTTYWTGPEPEQALGTSSVNQLGAHREPRAAVPPFGRGKRGPTFREVALEKLTDASGRAGPGVGCGVQGFVL